MHRQRSAYRWSVDCSVYLRADEGGRDNGRLLYLALLPQLRDLGYHQAFAGIAIPNPASVGLHEAMGFVCIGVYEGVGYKQGVWHDVGWWQLGGAEWPWLEVTSTVRPARLRQCRTCARRRLRRAEPVLLCLGDLAVLGQHLERLRRL